MNHPERDATHEPKFRQEGPEGAETNSIKTKEAEGAGEGGPSCEMINNLRD